MRHNYNFMQGLSTPGDQEIDSTCLLLRRALSVCTTAFIVLIWPQPPLSHILSHRSSHCSCQSIHRLISATLFVSIHSSSHLCLSKSSCNWLRHASSHHNFIFRWQIILRSSTNKSIRCGDAAHGVQAVKCFSFRFGIH